MLDRKNQKLHILAIAAHPDDVELGCSGVLMKHTQKGQLVGVVDLTEGELGTRGTVETRYQEANDAAKIMGLHVRENAQLRDGFFKNDESSVLKIIHYIRKWQPEIVITNAPEDRHPDHGKGCKLVTDACFLAGLSKIKTFNEHNELQLPWRPKRVFSMIQDRTLEPDFIVDISDVMENKIASILAYKTQFFNPDAEEPNTYISTSNFIEQIKYRDAINGKRIGKKFGEGLISVNILGISDLDYLVYPELA
jgi:bacillithiol biosynthesis deacetylase BshB1